MNNVIFVCSFEWPMTLAEAQSSALDIAVKNDVGLFSSSRTEMGRVVVNLSDVGEISQREWYVLVFISDHYRLTAGHFVSKYSLFRSSFCLFYHQLYVLSMLICRYELSECQK